MIYLEDDDVAAVCDTGALTIHRISRSVEMETPESREIITLKMEIQQIMKGSYSTFMQKEICEQPESVVNTMRGRVSCSMSSSEFQQIWCLTVNNPRSTSRQRVLSWAESSPLCQKSEGVDVFC